MCVISGESLLCSPALMYVITAIGSKASSCGLEDRGGDVEAGFGVS